MKRCENCEEEHSGEYGSGRFCSNKCARSFSTKADRSLINEKVSLKLTKVKKYCLDCNTLLHRGSKFCNNTCKANYNKKELIKLWLDNKDSGVVNGGSLKIRSVIKKYIMDRANNKCEECGEDRINPYSKKSILTIDHIDGNAANNRPENLKVLCPNCHAMTSTFGFINGKISARKEYRKKYRPSFK